LLRFLNLLQISEAEHFLDFLAFMKADVV